MNTLQVAQRLCAYLSVPHVTDLEPNDRETLIDALNAANRDWHDMVPSYIKQTMFAYRALATETQTIDVVNGARAFSWNTNPTRPLVDLLGSSVTVEGDAEPNVLVKTDELLYPYSGVTGEKTLTIYNNAIPLGYEVPRMVRPPCDMQGRSLLPANQHAMILGYEIDEVRRQGVLGSSADSYVIQSLFPSTGAAPYWFIRFFPAPAEGTIYHMVVEKYPEPVVFADLTQPIAYPVAAQHIAPCIIPIAAEHLIPCRLFNSDPNAIRAQAAQARIRISAMPQVLDSPQHGIDSGEFIHRRYNRY